MYGRTNRRRYVLLLVVLSSVTLITLDRRDHDSGALGTIGRGAHTVVSPVNRTVDAVARPIGDWFDGVFSAGSLDRENKRLKGRISDLEGQVRAARVDRNENANLKKIMDLPILDSVQRVVARVVNRSPGNFESTVTLNKGSNAGIVRDMPVMAHDGLVGRVVNVWRDGCKVLLITDSRFSVAVSVYGNQTVTGVASGRAGSSTMAVDLDDFGTRQNVRIRRGNVVLTSGFQGSTFPAGLQLGKVTQVIPQLGGIPPLLRVRPFVDLNALDYVAVLRWAPGQGAVTTTTTTSTTSTTVPGATTSTVPGATTSTTPAGP